MQKVPMSVAQGLLSKPPAQAPGGYTRVSPGMYRGPNGQVIRSAQPPGASQAQRGSVQVAQGQQMAKPGNYGQAMTGQPGMAATKFAAGQQGMQPQPFQFQPGQAPSGIDPQQMFNQGQGFASNFSGPPQMNWGGPQQIPQQFGQGFASNGAGIPQQLQNQGAQPFQGGFQPYSSSVKAR